MSFPTQVKHIIMITFENMDFNTVMSDSYFAYLANTYGNCTNYTQAGCHPSLPNYIAVTSGTTSWNGVNECGTDSPNGGWGSNNSENIFDLVNKAGLTWNGYAEPDSGTYSPCSTSNITVRHFPPMFYSDIVGNSTYCQSHIRPISDWYSLVSSGNPIPNFVWITPNICNDAHDCSLATASNWLKNTFGLDNIISKYVIGGNKDTAIFIWFDESGSSSNTALTYCSVISPISLSKTSNKNYNPYNVLSTFEWLLGLPSTGNNDNPANAMTDLFTVVQSPISVMATINPTIISLGQSDTISASVMGGTGPYTYVWTGLPGGCTGGNTNTITCTPTITGIFSITVTVTDSLGNTGLATGTLTVLQPTALSVSLVINPNTIITGQPVTFIATASGGTGSYMYAWYGLPGGCVGGNVNTFTCSPAVVGTFIVTVTVTDSNLHTGCSTGILHVSAPIITNLVQNPGFEIVSTVSNIPANWRTYSTGSPTFSYPQPGRIGGKSVEITYTSASIEAAWIQDVPIGTLNKTKQYILSCWTNTQNISGSGGANIQIEWFNGSTYVGYISTSISKATTWTQLSVTIPPNTIPTNATIARVMCKLGNCTGSARFDDISFS